MARDFIKADKTVSGATQVQQLLSYVSTLRSALDQGTKILATMSHLNDGTSFADIEAQYGLLPGKGQTVFDLVNGSVRSMNGTLQVADAKTITEIVGG